MGDVYFYHLTRNPVEDVLRTLLTRSLDQGWRVTVRGTDPERLAWLDEKLWLGPKEAFLPHGLAGGDHDARQPVLLTQGPAVNDPSCLISVDGADMTPEEVAPLARACILFDGLDADAVGRARQQWKALTDAGVGARYWSEESGKWQEKASKNT
ncbi:MAG: DNA polymerase III subunit chi [Pseudomonadota bacterium]